MEQMISMLHINQVDDPRRSMEKRNGPCWSLTIEEPTFDSPPLEFWDKENETSRHGVPPREVWLAIPSLHETFLHNTLPVETTATRETMRQERAKRQIGSARRGHPACAAIRRSIARGCLLATLGVLLAACQNASPAVRSQTCSSESSFTGLPPITDLGPGQTYMGEPGGLYPNSSNDMPASHRAAGEQIARSIVPLDANGNPDPVNGQIAMTDIEISLTMLVWSGYTDPNDPNYTPTEHFMYRANADPAKNPKLRFGNIRRRTDLPRDTRDPGNAYYANANAQLATQGIAPAQVQIVWFYPFPLTQGQDGGDESFPAFARSVQDDWKQSLRTFKQVYPNLKMVYLGSKHHTYVPPSTPGAVQDPQQHDLAWAVKWVVEDQINGNPSLNYDPAKGPVVAPWVAWGPYFWSDGPTPRAYDGFHYDCEDTQNFFANNGDFTHPGRNGVFKEAGLLLDFLKSDSTAAPWYYPRLR